MKQLHLAIVAVFKSWDNHRAKVYRRTQGIPDDLGTAVNVQTMVFGNKGETSGTGVAFTRDPSTGENFFYGEFLMNAQGEDVVAGVRIRGRCQSCGEVMPEALKQLYEIRETLEKHYRDMQDLEFTIEDKKLYMLQTRNGKRTAPAALKMAVEMVAEGLITKEEALMRDRPEPARPAAAPAARSQAEAERPGHRSGRFPGRRRGQGGLRRRRGRRAGLRGRAGHPGALGDQPRRHPRPHPVPGRHHQPRRHDLPRGGRGPRHGQAVHRRRAGPEDRREGASGSASATS